MGHQPLPSHDRDLDAFGVQQLLAFLKRKGMGILIFTVTCAVLSLIRLAFNPSYTASNFLQIQDSRTSTVQAVSEKFSGIQRNFYADDGSGVEQALNVLHSQAFSEALAKKLLEMGTAEKVLELLESPPELRGSAEVEPLAGFLRSRVVYDKVRSQVVRVSITHTDRFRTEDAINLVSGAVAQALVALDSEQIQAAKLFLNEQQNQVAKNLRDLDEQIFTSANELGKKSGTDLASLLNPDRSKLNEVEKFILTYKAELDETRDAIRRLEESGVERSRRSALDKFGPRVSLMRLRQKQQGLADKIAAMERQARNRLEISDCEEKPKPLTKQECGGV